MTCSVRRRKTPTFINASALCSRNQQEDFVDSLFHPGMSLKTVRKRNSPQRRILNPTFGFPVHLDQESLRMPVFWRAGREWWLLDCHKHGTRLAYSQEEVSGWTLTMCTEYEDLGIPRSCSVKGIHCRCEFQISGGEVYTFWPRQPPSSAPQYSVLAQSIYVKSTYGPALHGPTRERLLIWPCHGYRWKLNLPTSENRTDPHSVGVSGRLSQLPFDQLFTLGSAMECWS